MSVSRESLEKIVKRASKKTKDDDSLLLYTPDNSRFHVPYWISTGAPDLDQRLGGGIAGGRIIELFSKNESEGKSSIAAVIAKECQQMGGVAVYFDAENTVVPTYFEKFGLDVESLIFSFAPTLEKFFTLVENLSHEFREEVGPEAPLLFVLDSVAAAQPTALEDKKFDEPGVGVMARAMSSSLRKLNPILAKNHATLLLLNQSRKNIGVQWGDDNETPGGKAMKFYASQRIALRRCGKITDDGKTTGRVVGVEVEGAVVKNKVAVPWGKSKFRLYFGRGIDYAHSAFELLDRKGVLTGGGGGRYKIVLGGTEVSTTRVQFPKLLEEHGEELRDRIAELATVPEDVIPPTEEDEETEDGNE